jgi:hypothetical protein
MVFKKEVKGKVKKDEDDDDVKDKKFPAFMKKKKK